jgi:hypothetical protein
MSERLGGPAPAVGAVLFTGFRAHGTLARADVVAVYETADEWCVLVRAAPPLKAAFVAVDHLDFHVGAWRTADRENEKPGEGAAVQKRLCAAWKGSDR